MPAIGDQDVRRDAWRERRNQTSGMGVFLVAGLAAHDTCLFPENYGHSETDRSVFSFGDAAGTLQLMLRDRKSSGTGALEPCLRIR